MRKRVGIPLVAAIALTGFGHAFCACGESLAPVPADASKPARSCCGDHDSASVLGGRPTPCECQHCKVAGVVSPATVATAPNCEEEERTVRPARVSFLATPAPAPSPGGDHGKEPPGPFTVSQCALTVLLGRFLL